MPGAFPYKGEFCGSHLCPFTCSAKVWSSELVLDLARDCHISKKAMTRVRWKLLEVFRLPIEIIIFGPSSNDRRHCGRDPG